ncbi:MAG: efflux RND transporter permease subunit [Caulobacteraceae bacterium]
MLIYLLIVVNFQSWLDPFVIITALPAALAGIVWMLFATHTTLSVPALTGAIMCMGVATANSILVVSFARERLEATGDAAIAAVEAGITRFRPVLMTALAMIIGMAPMALGLGEGGEQKRPPRPRGDRRPDLRDLRDPDVRAGRLQHRPRPQGAAPGERADAHPHGRAIFRRSLCLTTPPCCATPRPSG